MEEVALLLQRQDWALHLSQAGHDYLSNLTVLKVVLQRHHRISKTPQIKCMNKSVKFVYSL